MVGGGGAAKIDRPPPLVFLVALKGGQGQIMINCVPFASHLLGMAGSCINIASNWLATAKNNKSPDPCPKRLLVGWQGQGGQLKRTGPRVGWLVGGGGAS